MTRRGWMGLMGGTGLALLAGAGALWRFWPTRRLDRAQLEAAWAAPQPSLPQRPRIYHLGHSLVGRTMPEMLAAFGGHGFESQLGWGASLKNHLDDQVPGFAESNDPPFYRPAFEAVDSGDYPVIIFTEMVDLRDAIRWHDTPEALAAWARRARAARPDVRLYLYESWHAFKDIAGFERDTEADRLTLWEGDILAQAMAEPGVGVIHLIPGGSALAACARAADAGEIPDITDARAFFADEIHYSDMGAWVVAMAHWCTLHGAAPRRPPPRIWLFEGREAGVPSQAAADALSARIWQVVQSLPSSGVSADAAAAA